MLFLIVFGRASGRSLTSWMRSWTLPGWSGNYTPPRNSSSMNVRLGFAVANFGVAVEALDIVLGNVRGMDEAVVVVFLQPVLLRMVTHRRPSLR